MTIHYAKLDNSARLQRVLELLQDGKEHSTLDIIHHAFVAAVNSCVDELRENGYAITCRRTGNKWLYKLAV